MLKQIFRTVLAGASALTLSPATFGATVSPACNEVFGPGTEVLEQGPARKAPEKSAESVLSVLAAHAAHPVGSGVTPPAPVPVRREPRVSIRYGSSFDSSWDALAEQYENEAREEEAQAQSAMWAAVSENVARSATAQKALLAEWAATSAGGRGMSRKMFGTTLYYPPHPYVMEQFPELSRDTQAVVIALGGSGVDTATGRTWMPEAEVLRGYGVSLVSFDYPYHMAGPYDKRYLDHQFFKKMVFNIVKHYKQAGKPMYFIGHSMGPSIIQELLWDSPNLVQGALLLAPGGPTTPGLGVHYAKMEASGALDVIAGRVIKVNHEGEHWDGLMDRNFVANKQDLMRTQIPVWVIAGDDDPWSTPELIKDLALRYPNGRSELVRGAGHLVMSAPGKRERLTNERLLEMIELTTHRTIEKPVNWRSSTPASLLHYYHLNSQWFREWFEQRAARWDHIDKDENYATSIMDEWQLEAKKRLHAMARDKLEMLRTKLTPAEFAAVQKTLSKPPEAMQQMATEVLMKHLQL